MRLKCLLFAALALCVSAEIERRQPIGRARYLHIPKAGTSFIITLRNAVSACRVKDYTCKGNNGAPMRWGRGGRGGRLPLLARPRSFAGT